MRNKLVFSNSRGIQRHKTLVLSAAAAATKLLFAEKREKRENFDSADCCYRTNKKNKKMQPRITYNYESTGVEINNDNDKKAVSYTHLTLPTTPYV